MEAALGEAAHAQLATADNQMAQALGRRRVGGGAAEQPEGDRGRCTHWRRPRLPAAGDASHRRIPAIDGVCWSCCQRCLCHCHQVDYWVLVRVHRANGELLLTDRCESTVGLPSLGPGISLTHHHHIQYASPSSPPRSHISSPRRSLHGSTSTRACLRQQPAHQHSTPTPAPAQHANARQRRPAAPPDSRAVPTGRWMASYFTENLGRMRC